MATDYFNEIIQKVSDTLINAQQNGWESIELAAYIADQYSRFTVASTNDGVVTPLVLSEQDSIEMDVLLLELQEITQKDDLAPWNIAVFTVKSDGDFNIDFRYEESSEGS